MRHHPHVVYACFGVQLVTWLVVIYCENFAPVDKRLEGKSLKGLKQAMYALQFVTGIIILVCL